MQPPNSGVGRRQWRTKKAFQGSVSEPGTSALAQGKTSTAYRSMGLTALFRSGAAIRGQPRYDVLLTLDNVLSSYLLGLIALLRQRLPFR